MKQNCFAYSLLVTCILAASCTCGPDTTTADGGDDAGLAATGGGTEGSKTGGGAGGGHAAGGGTASGDAGTDGGSCAPRVCGSAQALCGTVSDGCGHTLDCGACTCTTATFATDCPSKPCQVATGCSNNACTYEPITCGGFQPCTCSGGADGGCSDSELRACGQFACPSNYCDPQPSVVNGQTIYGNACLAAAEVRCGACGLGGLVCPIDGGSTLPADETPDGGAAFCRGVTLTGVNPSFVECDGASPSATILFVDPAAPTATHTGAKDAPFHSLDAALTAAAVRGSRAIIIGGSPHFAQQLVLSSGVSVLGGFTGFPTWVRDDTRRPVFDVPLTAFDGGSALVGLVATSITLPAEVANLDINTPDLSGVSTAEGLNNVGAMVLDSTNLSFSRVAFHVGAGQAGAAGIPGGQTLASTPSAGAGVVGVSSSQLCSQASWTSVAGPPGLSSTCDGTIDSTTAAGAGATVPKASATNTGFFTQGNAAPTGAQGGLASWTNNAWIEGKGGDGLPWPSAASVGAGGTGSLFWANGVLKPVGTGGTGTKGAGGRGGAGGSGGVSSEYYAGGGTTPTCRTGASGGAGGAGGCGGRAGTGGRPGGWSIGLATARSPGLLMSSVTVQIGLGGPGGPGGLGGPGTPGAAGGDFGPKMAGAPTDAYTGSRGGSGAAGQTGGAGGSGASGQSLGALCDPSGPNPSITALKVINPPANNFAQAQGCP